MPTRYFANSVDQNWDTLGNWWSDAAFTEGFSGTLTGVTVTDTDATVTCDSTAGLVVGRPITGDGIDTGTTVASITDGTTFELSQAAISTETSDLTCELHVIPVTGDDVVIATGNGTVAGTPSADVLGLVTVNGNSKLNVTLAAANFEFNDTSALHYSGAITGNFTFNDYSYNDTGSITGDGAFNDFSFSNSFNNSITGNVTFNDASYLSPFGYITGNATFTNTVFSTAVTGFYNPQQGAVSGTVAFPNGATFTLTSYDTWFWDTSYWTGTLAWMFNGSSHTDPGATLNGSVDFAGSSYHGAGIITGNATFTNTAFSTATTIYFNPQQGTVSGSVAFPNGATFTLESGESWTADTHWWAGPLAWVFNGTSVYSGEGYGSLNGDCTFNDYSQTLQGAIYGNPTFNDYSFNGCTVYGHPTFNDYSYNGSLVTTPDGGNTGGSATFNDNSYNVGTIWYTATFTNTAFSTATTGFFNPQQGDAYSSAAFPNGATFTLAGSESWDKDAQTWSGTLAWEFNDTSFNDTTGSIYGDCIFDDSSYNYGDVYGNCVFTGNSRNGDSYNATVGTVTGDFQWGSSDYNYGTITGDCVGGAVLNEYPGVIHGNCTVGTGGTVAQNASIINGDCDFLSGRYQYGTSGEINGNVTFSGNRVYGYGGMNGGVINGDVTFSDDTIHDGNSTINGAVTFNDTSHSQSTINGPVTFNDSAGHDTSNYTITGDCTFNDDAYTYNAYAGITGNCTFNDNSYNYSTVITGNATVRQHAAAFVAWRDYATSTYITGTLTLQFPEMDILGTGLL